MSLIIFRKPVARYASASVATMSAKPNPPSGVYTDLLHRELNQGVFQTCDGNQQNSHVFWKRTCDMM